MSLFQCELCGCAENTALSFQGCASWFADQFDWSRIEDRKGKKLCSACAPAYFKDNSTSGLGAWHGQFTRTFLPLGMFKTNRQGNLEHIKTGDTDYKKYALPSPKAQSLVHGATYNVSGSDMTYDADKGELTEDFL